jgi:hypothetical protein
VTIQLAGGELVTGTTDTFTNANPILTVTVRVRPPQGQEFSLVGFGDLSSGAGASSPAAKEPSGSPPSETPGPTSIPVLAVRATAFPNIGARFLAGEFSRGK